MEVLLAQPRGFCAGVERAIEIVERALEQFGAPLYVRHEIVHNKYVVDDLRAKGAVFVEELAEVPRGSTVIFSAHGVSKEVRAEAERRGLKAFDATCPLVTKVHLEVAKMLNARYEIVMVGGSTTSSNTPRLREVAEYIGAQDYRVGSAADLRRERAAGKGRIGVTAGASAPEVLVREVIARLRGLGATRITPLEGVVEEV